MQSTIPPKVILNSNAKKLSILISSWYKKASLFVKDNKIMFHKNSDDLYTIETHKFRTYREGIMKIFMARNVLDISLVAYLDVKVKTTNEYDIHLRFNPFTLYANPDDYNIIKIAKDMIIIKDSMMPYDPDKPFIWNLNVMTNLINSCHTSLPAFLDLYNTSDINEQIRTEADFRNNHWYYKENITSLFIFFYNLKNLFPDENIKEIFNLAVKFQILNVDSKKNPTLYKIPSFIRKLGNYFISKKIEYTFEEIKTILNNI